MAQITVKQAMELTGFGETKARKLLNAEVEAGRMVKDGTVYADAKAKAKRETVDHEAVKAWYLTHGSMRKTGDHFGISDSLVHYIVHKDDETAD